MRSIREREYVGDVFSNEEIRYNIVVPGLVGMAESTKWERRFMSSLEGDSKAIFINRKAMNEDVYMHGEFTFAKYWSNAARLMHPRFQAYGRPVPEWHPTVAKYSARVMYRASRSITQHLQSANVLFVNPYKKGTIHHTRFTSYILEATTHSVVNL